MDSFSIDHVAFPCFDVAATHRFYTEVLGAALHLAQSGPAPTWNADAYLLLAFKLPGGAVLDFFAFDGITRPAPDDLPKDIRHVALRVPTRADVEAVRRRCERASVPFWLEAHGEHDVHLYATDPNGLVLEIVAAEDSEAARVPDPHANARVLDAWLARETCTFRRARPDEAPALTELALRSKRHWGYDEAFMRMAREAMEVSAAFVADSVTVVAERGGAIAGFYSLAIEHDEPTLRELWIEPAAIGSGLGRKLWQHMLGSARRQGYPLVRLVSDPNAAGFYAKMGAEHVGAVESVAIRGRWLPLFEAAIASGGTS
jgi:catechol 2,3-dioxygenase-like lactoylglutathione lyase family enzyme/predicted N-acetyltransferase YhbS